MRWPWSRAPEPEPQPQDRPSPYSTHSRVAIRKGVGLTERVLQGFVDAAPSVTITPGVAMDANAYSQSAKASFARGREPISDVLADWYASQGFIGHGLAAMLAQHWLIDKACTMPARDAIRHGFEISSTNEETITPDVLRAMRAADRKYRLATNMEQFVRMGRVFGIRIVLFQVNSPDPLYYEKPFNPDGILPGSYRGMSQVDPQWCVPELNTEATVNAASQHFYEPTWWFIGGRRYHRTHLCIFRTSDVPDLLKASYGYGGPPVPQRIMERVYAAERTANEAPQLAMAKRLTVQKTDLAAVVANPTAFAAYQEDAAAWRDNFGVKVVDLADEVTQMETSLADLDTVIMTQYQIVAAAAGVPATKLLGTSPKGFGATGAYDEQSYHEELETIQTHDLTPLIERHHLMVMRSDIIGNPLFPSMTAPIDTTADWNPVDSPTAAEWADINLKRAQTGAALVQSGAIDGTDERNRIRDDPSSGYTGLPDVEIDTDPLGLGADPLAALAADATPRPLYVSRKLTNGADLLAWAVSQGITSTEKASDLHVTITYSRVAVDWMAMGTTWVDKLKVTPGGPRVVERLGDKGAVVLFFASSDLSWRHQEMRDRGASHDFEAYQPHVTISYDVPDDFDLTKVQPYRGALNFGPEIFETIDD